VIVVLRIPQTALHFSTPFEVGFNLNGWLRTYLVADDAHRCRTREELMAWQIRSRPDCKARSAQRWQLVC